MPVAFRDSLIVSHAVFRRYWAARTLSVVGDGVATAALVLYVLQTEGSGVSVAGLMLAAGLPKLIGPMAGALADRYDQRHLMIACDAGQALLFGLIAAVKPAYAVLLAVVALASALQTVFMPAGRASLPALVGSDRLTQANAWLGTSVNLKVALGPVIGSVLLMAGDVRWALAANAASFVVSALLLWTMPALPSAPASTRYRGVAAATWDGLSYTMKDPVVRSLVLLILCCSAFLAVDSVTLAFLTEDTLHLNEAEYGVAAGVFAIGMIVPSLVLIVWEPKVSPLALLATALTVGGLGTMCTGFAPGLFLVVVFQIVTGFGNGLENIGGDTLVQRYVPSELTGRVFGVLISATFAAISLSSAAAGALIDLSSPRAVFIGAGIGTLLTVAVLTPRLRSAAPAVRAAVEELES
ncbi:MFS transporter [Streptomyces sp. NPDC052301]|uniref:MFS transporter n=1 Tax=Streptomyces sp. NPDC052301 TaxID=3365687 RepID=UPI0037CDA7AE